MAANSGCKYPTPMPNSNRPPETTSRDASSLASTTGLRWKDHDARAQPDPAGDGGEVTEADDRIEHGSAGPAATAARVGRAARRVAHPQRLVPELLGRDRRVERHRRIGAAA